MRRFGNQAMDACAVIAAVALAAPAFGGGLAFVEAESSVDARGAARVAVSADGAHVYVTNEILDSVLVYERNVFDGELFFVEAQVDGVGPVDGLRNAKGVAVSPDGACVYAIGEMDDAVVVFERDAGTGALTWIEAEIDGVGGVVEMRRPNGVAVSGDDKHVYVASEQDDAAVAFERNLPDCDLDFIEAEVNLVSGVTGLRRARGVAVSVDGENVYLAGGAAEAVDDSVAVFSRDDTTGELTFVESHQNDVGGVEGLATAFGVAVSPDDASVYVAGLADKAIAVFSRETSGIDLGKLTFVERERDGGGVDGLNGVHSVAVSPDGAYVYAAGRQDNGVAVFRRDASTGQIAFLEVQKDETLGVSGLDAAQGVAVSPDNAHVYAAARGGIKSLSGDGAVVAFAVDACGNGTRGSDEQCDDGNVAPSDGCSATCQLELCGAAPLAGCREPIEIGKSLLKIKEGKDDNKDQLLWKWNKGEATTLADYDDPTAGDSYVVCVYDGSGGTQPLLALAVPAGGSCAGKDCWEAKSTSFKYKDKPGTPDGIQKAQLKEGIAGKAKIQFKGKSAGLFFAAGGNLLPPAGLTLPVRVQVTNTEAGTPICWEAVYGTALNNDAEQFKAKSDAPTP